MLRVALLLIVAVIAALASWQIISTDQGTVQITWFGTEITTSALFGLLLLVLVVAVALPLLRLVMFLVDAPGRINKASQRARVRRHISDAVKKGAELLAGGEWDGNRCQPTVFSGVTEEMEVLPKGRLDEVLDPMRMTEPGVPTA